MKNPLIGTWLLDSAYTMTKGTLIPYKLAIGPQTTEAANDYRITEFNLTTNRMLQKLTGYYIANDEEYPKPGFRQGNPQTWAATQKDGHAVEMTLREHGIVKSVIGYTVSLDNMMLTYEQTIINDDGQLGAYFGEPSI
jgi:hypothetical protein